MKDFLRGSDKGTGNVVVIVKTKKMTSQRKVEGMFAISSPGLFPTKKGMIVSAVCKPKILRRPPPPQTKKKAVKFNLLIIIVISYQVRARPARA